MDDIKPIERDLSKDEIDILDKFHSVVFRILKICKKIEPGNMDVEWLHKKLSLARNIDPLLIMNRAKDKLWTYRNEILQRDINFFLNNKFSQFVKNDQNKTFMYSLINLIKKKILDLSDEERNMIWDLVNQLLIQIIEYKKINGEYRSSS